LGWELQKSNKGFFGGLLKKKKSPKKYAFWTGFYTQSYQKYSLFWLPNSMFLAKIPNKTR
jgi:hypothetical protein